jgi:hypothetical protein
MKIKIRYEGKIRNEGKTRGEFSCMAGKTPDRSRKNASQKKAPAQPGSLVTPINRGDLAHGGSSSGTNKIESRLAEPTITNHPITNHTITNHTILEQIRLRAYELFEQRGRAEGFDQEDWARAEAEILARLQRGKSA